MDLSLEEEFKQKYRDRKNTLLEYMKNIPRQYLENPVIQERLRVLRLWAKHVIECPYCKKYFLTESDLQNHVLAWHEKE